MSLFRLECCQLSLGFPIQGAIRAASSSARDKALSKKLVAYHRIRVPEFTVVIPGRRPLAPDACSASAHRQVVVLRGFDRNLAGVGGRESRLTGPGERRSSTRNGTAAIVEQFIDGRELYVGAIGNERLDVLPPWDALFRGDRQSPRGSTPGAKTQYQKKNGIMTDQAKLDALRTIECIHAHVDARVAVEVERAIRAPGHALDALDRRGVQLPRSVMMPCFF